MVPCHSYIFGTWRSKEVKRRELLKSSYGGGQAIKGGTNFYGWELTPLDTMGLSNYYYICNIILSRKIQHDILYFVITI